MIPILLLAAASLASPQAPATANPACALLTASQITSLIGAAKTVPVSSAPLGSACMLMAGNNVLVVRIVNTSSSDEATRVFESSKRIASGDPIPGWTLPAYAGRRKSDVVMGFLNGQTFTEVALSDASQSAEAAGAKLRAVMKDVAGR
jgi:hypothetical protein